MRRPRPGHQGQSFRPLLSHAFTDLPTMVPHLITALNGPIDELERRVLDSMPAIERWFRLEWMEHTPPFYSAATVRNAGFKLAAVNTSLHPDGWHNLTPEMLPLAVQAAMVAIEKICPEAHNLLIVPKNGHHSQYYLSNLARLQRIFRRGGLHVRLGSIDPAIKNTVRFDLPDGQHVTIEPALRMTRRIGLHNFDPCTILLNNDLQAGIPGILEDIHEQYLLPPLHAGWATRRKSRHFKCYEDVAKRLAKLLGIDPWLIKPMFEPLHVRPTEGVDALRAKVDSVMTRLRRKYKEYGIKESPFVVVKSDHDGHDLPGCMMVRDVKDLSELTGWVKRFRDVHTPAIHDFFVQEGLLTQETMNDSVAELVIYMMDRYVVGGFYRVLPYALRDESLNGPESDYVPLAFDHSTHLPQPGVRTEASAPNRFYMYGVVGRLAMLAASYELEATDPDAEIDA